jgi:hypothetical protein
MAASGMQAYSAIFARDTFLTINLSPKRIIIAKVIKDSSSAMALSMNCGAPKGIAIAPIMLITVSTMTTYRGRLARNDCNGGEYAKKIYSFIQSSSRSPLECCLPGGVI